jgi:uridine kinase
MGMRGRGVVTLGVRMPQEDAMIDVPVQAQTEHEVEAKYMLTPERYRALLRAERIGGLPVTRRWQRREYTAFYDTPDHALRSHGVVLRARADDDRPSTRWTAKTAPPPDPGATDAVRAAEELFVDLPGGVDDLARAWETPPVRRARALVGDDLRLIDRMIVDRTYLPLDLGAGDSVLLNVDRIRVAGDAVFVEYELEVESGADPAAFAAFLAQVESEGGLEPSRAGKRIRVRTYAQGHDGPPQLDADDAIAWVVARTRRLLAHDPGRRRVVLLSGASGSGKSTIAKKIVAALAAPSDGAAPVAAVAFAQDDLFLGLPDVAAPIGADNHFDLPRAVDIAGSAQVVERWLAGEQPAYQQYEMKTGARTGPRVVVPTGQVLVVEGLWPFDPRMPGDLRVYIATSAHAQLLRRLTRDVIRTPWTPAHILEYCVDYALPAHAEYREAWWRSADVVLLNEYRPAEEVGRLPDRAAQLKAPTARTGAELEALGAVHEGTASFVDEYLIPEDRPLDGGPEVLRFRTDGAGGTTFGYKGRGAFGNIRVTPTWSFPIPTDVRAGFRPLPYRPVLLLDHVRRDTYRLGAHRLHLDEVQTIATGDGAAPVAGRFLEVVAEPAHLDTLAEVARAIDPQAVWSPETYVEMALRRHRAP